MVRDLTQGKPTFRIMNFMLPILLGNLLQQIYNLTDSIIVGRFVGKDAFAAVGSTGCLNFLVIGFMLGLSGFVYSDRPSFWSRRLCTNAPPYCICCLYFCCHHRFTVITVICKTASHIDDSGKYFGNSRLLYPNYFHRNSCDHVTYESSSQFTACLGKQ